MAIKMTRAEYEATYGVQPPATSPMDISPVKPIKMTRAEYEATYNTKPEAAEQGIVKRRGSAVIETLKDTAMGRISIPEASLQAAGAGAGLVGDVFGKVIEPVAKPIAKGISKITPESVKTKAGDVIEKYQNWAKENPRAAKNLESAVNIASLLPVGKGAQVAGKTAAGQAIKSEAKVAANEVKKVIKTVADKRAEDIILKKGQEIFNIENNYAKGRKAMGFSKDAGEASRLRIASTDVLANSVDENGLLRTKNAIEQYKAQTIDGMEDVVKQNLVKLGERIDLDEVKIRLEEAVRNSGLEGADLKVALRKIKSEIDGYSLQADEAGTIPLSVIQDAKVSQYKQINYLTPPEQQTYRKSIARGLKETIEKNSKFNVKEVNDELAKYWEDIALLERLDGAKVKGGKLGKYFAQISGNIAGGLAGGAIGGVGGSAVGTVIGGELAGRIKGNLLSKTLGGKTGRVAPKNPILEKARQSVK